ncbi:transglycosylase domain-containing protein [Campylobacter sp. RM13119]|uniref:transglycosylase domain-containing protein n=1 Tax=Campylobacter californiensis TaxID=1032243 RepID=UPI0014739412|nr:transglycosylase domain-containing protein [Campylobacter sp. RM13119]MBE3605535.1 transglycosylase domain-containing protein [Campylobacter sp. RM13119]
MKTNIHINVNGYIVKADNGEIIGVCSDENKIYAKRITTEIPEVFIKLLLSIEDKRFYNHIGIDLIGIARAFYRNLQAGKIIEGGSTITQQLSRSYLNDNSKTFKRKFAEIFKALKIEIKFSKQYIIDKYIESIYMGSNIYGFESASIKYFAKRLHELTKKEFISLIVLLRGPNLYINNNQLFLDRYKSIITRLNKTNLISKNQTDKYLHNFPKLKQKQISVVPSEIISAVTKTIERNKLTINSTINYKIQNKINKFVNSTKDFDSVICIKNGKIAGFSSKHGNHYIFNHFGNVGSTLKPFIYLYLRSHGVEQNTQIPTTPIYKYKKWIAKEAFEPTYNTMSLAKALEVSNNTVFLNASYKVGFDNISKHIANLFNKENCEDFPSLVLGSTPYGISLYELSMAYYNLFSNNNHEHIDELKSILRQVSINTLGLSSFFCKTGTTNNNRNRYIILGNHEIVFAFLRDERMTYDSIVNTGKAPKNFTQKIKGFFNELIR